MCCRAQENVALCAIGFTHLALSKPAVSIAGVVLGQPCLPALSGAVSSACAHWRGPILLIAAVPIRSPELILHLSGSAHLGCHGVDREECREGGDCIVCLMNCCVRSRCLSQTQECLGNEVSIICQ